MSRSYEYDAATPALVLGTGITVLGVIRGLGKAGIRTYCLSSRLSFLQSSRFCHTLPEDIGTLSSGDNLTEFLQKLPFDRAILIPCSDEWVMACAKLDEPLRSRFPTSQPSAGTLDLLVDKGGLEKLLSEKGMPHPRTMILESEDDLQSLPDDFFVNAFLKPCNSERFFKTYWVKAFRVKSREDAIERYRRIRQKGLEMVIQEYIPGPSDNHYFIDGFVDRNGRICTTFARRRIRMYPPDFGNSSFMTTIPLQEVSGAVDTLTKMFEAIKYRGIYSAEFKKDDRDGRYCLLEVNARPWWYIWFTEISGIPISEMAYRDALQMEVTPVTDYKPGVSLVYPYYDLYICWRMNRQGRLKLTTWIKQWATAKQAVFSLSDPMPSIRWFFGEILRRLRGKR